MRWSRTRLAGRCWGSGSGVGSAGARGGCEGEVDRGRTFVVGEPRLSAIRPWKRPGCPRLSSHNQSAAFLGASNVFSGHLQHLPRSSHRSSGSDYQYWSSHSP
ncbi:hypothetical protein T440DRAFT_270057 [Plenodomus tracheiphilus IPT5]|uniref:Uncharacterized protein n=1 Tax=Plenodomus tracheiphilus IPT5 TaxID=1408161 RepID=A0A6A7BHK3_9PLEO|nr:hypothetical protein T440DRAFT_270057 [Plenodomus tracheiphilus IPT5]